MTYLFVVLIVLTHKLMESYLTLDWRFAKVFLRHLSLHSSCDSYPFLDICTSNLLQIVAWHYNINGCLWKTCIEPYKLPLHAYYHDILITNRCPESRIWESLFSKGYNPNTTMYIITDILYISEISGRFTRKNI